MTLWELLLKPGQRFVFEYICVSMHQEPPSEESTARTLAELGLQDLLEILGFGGGRGPMQGVRGLSMLATGQSHPFLSELD